MRRKRYGYEPQWRGVFESYSKAWIRHFGWRVRHIVGGYDDQLAECALVFSKVRSRYKVNDPRHFMALYKTSLSRHWITLARKNSQLVEVFPELNRTRPETDDASAGSANARNKMRFDDEGHLSRTNEEQGYQPDAELLSEWHFMSAELKDVITMLVNAPNEVLNDLFGSESDETRQSWLLCRRAGHRNVAPVLAELRAITE